MGRAYVSAVELSYPLIVHLIDDEFCIIPKQQPASTSKSGLMIVAVFSLMQFVKLLFPIFWMLNGIVISAVSILSSSNTIDIPSSLRNLTVLRQSLVFRANLLIDFAYIRSIFPRLQSLISLWNSVLFSALVPVIPSSAYMSTSSSVTEPLNFSP